MSRSSFPLREDSTLSVGWPGILGLVVMENELLRYCDGPTYGCIVGGTVGKVDGTLLGFRDMKGEAEG